MIAKPEYGFLPKGFELEAELLDQLSARSGSQRCLIGHDELLLIVHEVPCPGDSEREALVFWRTAGGGWFGPDSGKGLGLLSALLDRYEKKLDAHEEVLDEPAGATVVFEVARHAVPMARSARNLGQALEQALVHDEDSRELMGLRERCRDLEQATELLNQDAKLVLEFRQAGDQREAVERLNEVAFRQSLMLGFFLPLLGLGGLLGMNVDIPEFVKPWFWGVFVSGFVLGIGVCVLVGWRGHVRK